MSSRAFTLIEMLLATVLSAVLMLAILSVLAGVARDRRLLLHALPPATPDAGRTLVEWDLHNARTMARGDDGAILILAGNNGIRRATLRPDGRLVQVTYRAVGAPPAATALWRQQRYLDDPARPEPWQELVAADLRSLSLQPAPADEPTPIPPRVKVTFDANEVKR